MLRLARRFVVMPLVALLCVAAAVLWRRSHGGDVDMLIGVGPTAKLNAAASYQGKLVFFSSNVPFDPGKQWSMQPLRAPLEEVQPLYEGLFEQGTTLRASLVGFQLGHGTISVFKNPPAFTAVTVPHWFVVLVTAVPTVLWVRGGVQRWRWGRQGRCRSCGYDLRSSPDRCPECGEVPKKRRTAAPAAPMAAAVLLAALAPAAARGDPVEKPQDGPAAKRIAELNLSGGTLEDAFELMRDMTHANIVVRWPALKAAGVERARPVKLRLWDVRLGAAINIVLETTEPQAALGWSDEEGVITVSTKEDLEHSYPPVVYDVRDLIDVVQKECTPDPPDEPGPTRQEVIDEITRLITETVDPESWRDAGGSVGSMREIGGRLIVTQSPENQAKLKAMLARLREEFAKPVPTLKPVAATAPADGDVLVGDLRVYDVRDLLRAIVANDAEWSSEPRTAFEVEAQLVGVVVENVEPGSWDVLRPNRQQESAESNSVNIVGGRLLVRQTGEVHALLQRFLSELRSEFATTGVGAATSPSAPTRPARRRVGGRSQSAPGSLFAAPPPAR